MAERNADAFLSGAGWGAAQRAPLAGDASNRRYERLTGGPDGAGAVLMDAPPQRGEDVRPFTAIARHLSGLGLSAPAILAEDAENGFLLLEDLGDALFARVIPRHPALEPTLYAAAVDLLADLHRAPPPGILPAYDADLMADLACLPFDWYLPALGRPAPAGAKQAFAAAIRAQLARHAPPSVLVLRDYHAENLIWLPSRTGTARVGLLDFQDAMVGHPAYDLVSLLEDARRDVPPPLQAHMLDRYIAASGADAGAFRRAYALLGAQRNLRILGVFARLCLRDGKPSYLPLMPRVWGHLMHDLSHPALAGLRSLVLRHLPEPTPALCHRIARRCSPRP
ncbi:aminoglycoside phosphotransferase family protein [Rhodovulum adriaticum]|uniref:Aminoglycoside phosphotransferase domain-containing protein n=1 Tax=Rhodovulum adriaticum TaxID=35804 RepID=A0A4R2P0V1_RHOAD|nr:phosphotransferase [Rhodovulum adriaticum]MBK1636151.1 aminoglycoside phosphotransferase [Rhodovulum adriaticum]TCP27534.1 hypothetical protein EV656_101442 [Rhodovulum adriaticum]